MDLNSLKIFARNARSELLKIVSLKIESTLKENSQERRENRKAVKELESKLDILSKEELIEEVAYTWFNRFTALSYMDINDFNDVRVILPLEGNTRPEILSNAISGVFDNNLVSENMQNIVSSILSGRSPSNAPEKEAYRLILVSVCNKLHHKMPFLFEKISDYTELLIPNDLLSNSSILAKIRDVLKKENCQDVEVIGWLYQFYISEKKEEVLKKIKNRIKVTPENIPAATQLFTPNWIVKYMVENSLGRLWMLNNPNSNLKKNMKFYIDPDENEINFLKISSPEEIKICDPACGSGHILIYAFDILYLIYEEEGYDKESIPSLILKNNLYGIELDKRAGQLSYFALIMKAARKQRKYINSPFQPNICILENIKFDTNEIEEYKKFIGNEIDRFPVENILNQFADSKNLGSLILPILDNINEIKNVILGKNFNSNIFLQSTNERVLKVLNQSEYLSQKYHVVVANPPYMGSSGINSKLSDYLKNNFNDAKADLFSSFILRSTKLALNKGHLGLLTPFTWMFLPTFKQLRLFLLENITIISLVQLEYNAFEPAMVPVCSFILQNNSEKNLKGSYIKLSDFKGSITQAPKTIEAINNPNCGWFYKVPSSDLKKIDGYPIIFWLSDSFRKIFNSKRNVEDVADKVTKGIYTGDNNRFLRLWYEISISNKGWKKYDKAGGSRRWFGSAMHVLDWRNNGEILSKYKGSGLGAMKYYGNTHLVWSGLTSGNPSFRYADKNVWFDDVSPSIVGSKANENLLSFLNCNIATRLLMTLNPTLHYQIGDVKKIPINELSFVNPEIPKRCIEISRFDWDSYETSWDFKSSPLLSLDINFENIENAFSYYRRQRRDITNEMLTLEEENNRFFIEQYGLQDELKANLELNQITLSCNPAYRYGQKISSRVQEERLLKDVMKEFISYSVGCMFGRYSLDEPGLILANQGEDLEDYLKRVPKPQFMPDDDNVIPILELDWFEDDITLRFKKFLRITFGNKNFEENLRFIENSIGKDIRKYFLTDFYRDHIQNYKKRPIYWMFSSPKGSFNSLIYLHRYQKDTVSILLDKYLREFLLKLRAEKNTLERVGINNNSSSGDKNKAFREIQKIDNIITELQNWEKEIIFPLASQRIDLNLDDGVKINYPKFGKALKKISGLN